MKADEGIQGIHRARGEPPPGEERGRVRPGVTLKPPSPDQLRATVQAAFGVHLQQPNRSASGRRQSAQAVTLHSEMLLPHIPPWMEERDNCTCVRINPAEVCPLVPIAAMTRPGQILQDRQTTVLTCHDVLEVEWLGRRTRIRQPTVFTASVGPLADNLAQGLVHPACAESSCRAAFNRKVARMSPSSMKRSYSRASSDVS